ncbi:N-acetylglucosamine kinase [Mangrovivirga sp. M17]|uniref:N-acetylglucosamine kinase n=1 Tax=Mangrovivirga halotolerans TaxID=2993936 RepID=A0ABT3RRQ1_9BACT|nr:N-acetylglucosamine kinase [Mangrovivirga halotolerans]MCX2744467.1 N-acetylglucosamine kinase [Mangrovivirga halotolerans]
MIYIVDSGGTGADWRFISEKGEISQLRTEGLQANISSDDDFRKVFLKVNEQSQKAPEEIYFYGAGCHRKAPAEIVENHIKSFWGHAKIHVHGDVLAAARSSCGSSQGISCILGTGASAAYFDAEKIVKISPSLGYILGDEGSGADLGKMLIKGRQEGSMPDDLATFFDKRFGEPDKVLTELYQAENKQRYLAGFSKFMIQHMAKPWMARMIYSRFDLFFKQLKKHFPEQINSLPVHFTGGIAFYFSNLLRQVANDNGITVRNITETPIAGLTLYHKSLIERSTSEK